MKFSDFQTRDRRATVLRILCECPERTANDSSLQLALESLGHPVSVARVRETLVYLAAQQLVTVEYVDGGAAWVCQLTALGANVARGRETHPGVRGPVD